MTIRKSCRMLSLFFLLMILGFQHAEAASWYVDKDAKGSNNGASWTNAWNTFNAITWGNVRGGDTIYICGGSTSKIYSRSAVGTLTIGASGSAGSPITIRPGQDIGHNGVVVMDGDAGTNKVIQLGSSQYITIDGEYNGDRHIVVQNNAQTADAELISASGSGGDGLRRGLIIKYLEIKTSGSGIRLLYSREAEISYNYIHDISCEAAVDLDGSAIGLSGDLYDLGGFIHHNTIEVNNPGTNSGYGPDAIQASNGPTIYNNVIKGVTGNICSTPNHQDGIQVGGNYYKAYKNRFHGLSNASMESDWSSSTCGYMRIWNNVFTQSRENSNSHGIEMKAWGVCTLVTDFLVLNNTFVDFTGFIGVRVISDGGSQNITNTAIRNNIFYNTGKAVTFELSGSYTCGSPSIDYSNNLINGNTGTSTCKGSTFNQLTGAQTGAPQFKSYAVYNFNNDYSLQASSSAIDRGIALSSYLTTDYVGIARPQGSAWDIGAYEYSGIVTQKIPLVPSSISIQ